MTHCIIGEQGLGVCLRPKRSVQEISSRLTPRHCDPLARNDG